MLKKIDKLVIKEFLGPFFLTFFVSLFCIVIQFLWKYVDELVGKGLEWYLILELLFYASASFVPLALPLAILLSSIMTFGTLGEHYELVSCKSAGISLLRVMRPMFFISIILAITAFFFANNILPFANIKFKALLQDIQRQKPAFNIKEGAFYSDIEGYLLKVGKKDEDGKTLRNIILYDYTSGRGNDNMILAKSGEMLSNEDGSMLILRLFDGNQYQDLPPQKGSISRLEHLRTSFKTYEKVFDLTQFQLKRSDEDYYKDHYRMMNVKQLSTKIDTLKIEINRRNAVLKETVNPMFGILRTYMRDTTEYPLPDSIQIPNILEAKLSREVEIAAISKALSYARNVKSYISVAGRDLHYRQTQILKHIIEWHRKYTLSAACIVLFLIGAPLGSIIRKGGLGMPLLMSIIFFITYHVLSIIGEKIAEENVLSADQGMWMGTSILLPIGIFLAFKSNIDSPIFNIEWYYKLKLPSRFRRFKFYREKSDG